MLETRNTSTGTRRAETIVIHRQRDIMRLVNPLLSFSRTDRSQSTKSQENIKLPIRHMANTDQPMAKWAVSGIFSYLETLLINSEVLKFLQLWFRFLTFPRVSIMEVGSKIGFYPLIRKSCFEHVMWHTVTSLYITK